MIVEVFKTNVQRADHSARLIHKLLEHFPQSRVNFDLDDCDKVLRVEGENICPKVIMALLAGQGYQCEALD